MKKNLTALMLCLVSILFISWRNPFSSSSHTQNVTVKVNEEYADWTEVGTVQLNSNPYGGAPSTSNTIWTVHLWVKIVNNVTYYKVGSKVEYAVSPRPNPYYQNDPKQHKWVVDLDSHKWYLNLPE